MNKKEYEEFTKTYQSLYEKAMDVLEARNKIYNEVLDKSRDSHEYVTEIDFRDNEVHLGGQETWGGGSGFENYDDYFSPEFLYDTDNALAGYRSELENYVAKIKQEEADREEQRVDKEYQQYLKLKDKYEGELT